MADNTTDDDRASGNDGGVAPGVLADIRVAELSATLAAGLAGRMLHGYGAHVTRLGLGPAAPVLPLSHDEDAYVHSGKATLPHGDDAWRRTLDAADLVVSDLQPHQLLALGLDWDARRVSHPRAVVVSTTAYGLTGPHADRPHTNATAFAAGGIMGLTGDPDRAPLLTGGSHAYALAAMHAFAAACTLLVGRDRNGGGALADLSGQACAAGMLEYYGQWTSFHGDVVRRLGNHTRATWGVYPCADGWCGVFALARQVPALFALLDDPELDEERFRDPLQRGEPANDEELSAKIYVFLAGKTMDELRALGLSSRVPFGVVLTPRDLLTNTALTQRGAFDHTDDGDGGPTVPGRPFPPFAWDTAQKPAAPGCAPSSDDAPVSGATAGDTRLPLDGVRVLDLTMMWAGPYATLRLGEMGADVVKIESPSAWDNIRTLLPQPGAPDPWNTSVYFNAYNREKRSLTLDLAQPAGRNLLLRLVAGADVLIENYRADVLDKLALSPDVLFAANPKLVAVSMAAFGKTGDDRGYVGFGPVIELQSGLASLTGYGDGEPFKTGLSYGDPVAGTAAVAAVALGLRSVARTGVGIHVDLAQRETAMVLAGEAFVAASRGEVPVHRANRDARCAPQGAYACTDDDRWVVLTVRDGIEWHTLCDVIGADGSWRSWDVAARHAQHDAIDAMVSAWTAARSAEDAAQQLCDAGVPAAVVHDTASILDDPQLVGRGFWQWLDHPKTKPYRQHGVAWPLAGFANAPRRRAPFFGEHNEELLRGELGCSEEELAALRRDHVIADAPINPSVG